MSSSSRNIILVVDDDPMDWMLINRSLQELDLGTTILRLADGQAAVDYLSQEKANWSSYALILLDLKMPKISGLDVLKLMQNDHLSEQIPVVVMSSSGIESDIKAAYELGARAYVTKPIQHQAFREVVKTTGRFWLNHNVLPDL